MLDNIVIPRNKNNGVYKLLICLKSSLLRKFILDSERDNVPICYTI